MTSIFSIYSFVLALAIWQEWQNSGARAGADTDQPADNADQGTLVS